MQNISTKVISYDVDTVTIRVSHMLRIKHKEPKQIRDNVPCLLKNNTIIVVLLFLILVR
jgi:hypothetical protein